MKKTKSTLNEKLNENSSISAHDSKTTNTYLNRNKHRHTDSVISNNEYIINYNSDYESDNKQNLSNSNNHEENNNSNNNNSHNSENNPEIQKSIDFITRIYDLQQKSRLPPNIRKLYTSLSLYNNNNNNN